MAEELDVVPRSAVDLAPRTDVYPDELDDETDLEPTSSAVDLFPRTEVAPGTQVDIRTNADLQTDAFDVLANSADYESGEKELTALYEANPTPETANIISEFGNDLQHRFRTKPFEFIDTPDVAPIDIDLTIADPIERTNKWEDDNLKFIDESDDALYVLNREYLKRSISAFASEARRDEHAMGEGAIPWAADKLFRVAEGAVGPFARLVGAEETEKAIYERTQRSRDEGVAGLVATGLGAVVPFALGAAVGSAVGGPVGGVVGAGAVFSGQAAGEARAVYKRAIEETGDEGDAATAAGLTVAAQALGIIPAGRLLGGAVGAAVGAVVKKLGGNAAVDALADSVVKGTASETEKLTLKAALLETMESQKRKLSGVLYETAAAGGLGAAGRVLGNIANNIALDENGDITHGAVDSFLANAILGGAFSGAHALIENATLNQAKRMIEEISKNPVEEAKLTDWQVDEQGNVYGKPLFFKDKDGFTVPTDDIPPTYDERVAQHREFEAKKEDYINEKPDEATFTNEKGEGVEFPYGEDTDIPLADRPAQTILLSPDELNAEISVGAYALHVAKKLGAKFELRRNIMNGALGAFYPKKDTVRILRSLGADPERLKKVLAHEIGHFVDKIEDPAFTRLFQMVKQTTDGSDTTYAEAKNISAKWRGGWDGSPGDEISASPREQFAAYRNKPEEIYADIFSAFVNNPKAVKDLAPNLYKNLEENLAKVPELNELFNNIQKAETDPAHITRLDWALSQKNRAQDADISYAARNNRIKNNSVPIRLRKALDLAYRTVFERYAPVKRIGRKLEGKARAKFEEHFSDLVSKDNISFQQTRFFDAPISKLTTKLVQAKIDPHMWAQLEWDNNMIHGTTGTIEAIKANPAPYMEAASIIKSYLAKQRGINSALLEREFNLANMRSADDLIKAFTRIGLIGDAAEIYSISDFIQKYDPKDPNRFSKATADYNRAVANLNKRRESIPVEKLKEHVETLQNSAKLSTEVKTALSSVMKPGAFSVRKYLVNPGGRTLQDAEASRTVMQQDLGPDKWRALQGISKDWHAALSSRLDNWEKSGIFTPELMERIRLNKDSYIMVNILKYFEGDENIEASIRQAVGSLSESGNEITSTLAKTKALDRRAAYQRSTNAAVDIAADAGQLVEFRPRKKDEDIFATRDRLNKEDPDHSYLIKYQKGVPYLAKISGGKGFAEMSEMMPDNPLINTGLILSDQLSKLLLVRQFKTVFSPAFVAFQKFYDYRNEAILANSLEATLGLPIHYPGKLRGFRKQTREEIAHFRKTGELTGTLKKVVDLDGAALGKALMEDAGWQVEGSAEDNAYAVFGQKMPNEDTYLERIGNYTEKQLDKVGGAFFKRIAEMDELTTKVTGFRIGKEILGMGDNEAARLSRERFGIPDPLGGGRAAPLINRMFLFGVAHFNGVKNLVTIWRDMPKTAAIQAAYRGLIPKLLVSAPVMGAALTQLMGQEEGDKYKLLYDMIPTIEKQGKGIMVLGAQDGQGNFHNFTDIDPKEIQSDWKAWYVRIPQSREITALTKVLWPVIENMGQGEVSKAVTEGAKAGLSQSLAGVQPAVQYLINFGELLTGRNPTDFFRQKGIIPEGVYKSGSTTDKLAAYGQYVASAQWPAVVPYNPFATTEPVGAGETTMQRTWLAGPMMRSFVGISNYGLIEKSREAKEAREKIDLSIKLSTGEATQSVLEEYRKAAGQIASLGKGWKEKVGPDVASKIHYLNKWHSSIWQNTKNELRAAMEAGDTERYEYLIRELETYSSKYTLPEVRGLSSSFEKKTEPDQK